MENLSQVLSLLNLPEGKAAVVQARVERRLAAETPAVWCEQFRARAARLLAAEVLTPDYGEHYTVLRNLLSQQGIANYVGQHGMEVPDEERDLTPKPRPPVVIATRPALPAHLRPANKQAAGNPVLAPPPRAVAVPDPASVLEPTGAVDLNSATPAHRDTIHGMFVERADASWVLECDINRGARVQVSTMMDDGNEHGFEMDMPSGNASRLDLQLPAGRRPSTVVVVVLNELNEEVGRGIIGGAAN